MSREIKFRGKTHKNKWVYGTYYKGVMYPTSFTGHYINDQLVDPETIGQFTGLKDKNGKEIYEGDVLELHAEFERMNNVWDDDDKTTTVHFGSFSVIFNNDLAAFDLKKIDGNVSGWCLGKENESELEVIGNIYEHPHLLK